MNALLPSVFSLLLFLPYIAAGPVPNQPTLAPSSIEPTVSPSSAPSLPPFSDLDGDLRETLFAGSVEYEMGVDNGYGTQAEFNRPQHLSITPDGLYALVSDTFNHLIRHIEISCRHVTRFVGVAGTSGFVNGVGTNSRFFQPSGVSISPCGTFALVADLGNQMIRHLVLSTLSVTTLAGSLDLAYGSADGIGTNSFFFNPRGVSISPLGEIALVADSGNHLIRLINLATASVTTLAGDLEISVGSANGVGTNSLFFFPYDVQIAPLGDYALVAEYYNNLIRRIDISAAIVTTLAGDAGVTGLCDGMGTNARFNHPSGVSISPDGEVALVADTDNHLIRHIIISTGSVSRSAGEIFQPDDVYIASELFRHPVGVCISPDGYSEYALVADTDNHVIRKFTTQPTSSPTVHPTISLKPTFAPSTNPSVRPTTPSVSPTFAPTVNPTTIPSVSPSVSPSVEPSLSPTFNPSTEPTLRPSATPSVYPTLSPSASPTLAPTYFPISGRIPTLTPTARTPGTPTKSPSNLPTFSPSVSYSPTLPTTTSPTFAPSTCPTLTPSTLPSTHPSLTPTIDPTLSPTVTPSTVPTMTPTAPTPAPLPKTPTLYPTTISPSVAPTRNPTTRTGGSGRFE
jgi:hypothetical protein